MTKDLAINILTEHIRLMGDDPSLEEDRQAFEFAISALEQEPCETSTDEPMTMVYPTIFCEDTISRAEALDQLEQAYNIMDATDRVKAMPSVQPIRKGQWKYFYQNYECSECGFVVEDSDVEVDGYEFCPICGSYNGGGTDADSN